MNTQKSQNVRLVRGEVARLAVGGGQLTVTDGEIWLTRRGDAVDHVLRAGQSFRLGADQDAVIETWLGSPAAAVRWVPRHRTLAARLVASGLRRAAATFALLARQAAAVADRAQGAISVRHRVAPSAAFK